MKFKVGDKVRLMKNSSATHGFKVGEICKIVDISNKGDYYPIKIANKKIFGFVNNKHIQKMSEQCYTYEDLKKSPIGTKLTFENGSILTKIKRNFYTNGFWDVGDEVLKDNYGGYYLGKIIKIDEPTYSTVYEYKPEILDEVEKRYLRGVIRPFRDKVKTIRKTDNSMNGKDNEYLTITLKEEPNMDFPDFKPNTMYKGMKLYKEYTLEELGL